MNQPVSIATALRLPAPDIKALMQGRMIAALPHIFIPPGQKFALYPVDTLINRLPAEQYYRSNFLPIAKTTLAHLGSDIMSG